MCKQGFRITTQISQVMRVGGFNFFQTDANLRNNFQQTFFSINGPFIGHHKMLFCVLKNRFGVLKNFGEKNTGAEQMNNWTML